jgi:hypothetical protein
MRMELLQDLELFGYNPEGLNDDMRGFESGNFFVDRVIVRNLDELYFDAFTFQHLSNETSGVQEPTAEIGVGFGAITDGGKLAVVVPVLQDK